MKFQDKVVLVTGGGAGIGRAVARGFAREGAQVVVAARGHEALGQTVKLIEAEDGRAAALTVDVSDSASVAGLVEQIVERYGRLDIAINNAGVLATGEVADQAWEDFARVVDINLTGTFLSMKHEIPAMLAGGGGVIVNFSSQMGAHKRIPGFGAYAASKAGVTALTRTAALEYIGRGIRINTVSPGPHDTAMSMRPGETEADRAARVKQQLPIGRVGSLDEITGTVLWLASEDAGFVVGSDIVVDGGSTA
ncbi:MULTISPECIES: SDR family NAD(P)-dependent oxidoreductase [Streptosporangium]|uniref:NAD(P)-dependent dehydrogenase (Short-subunit alcohol dehydrogenase family) n=1 Tax=Streptosporangium brasiliense TaxID=47480 RepID=A0ABT9R4B1_9ACTN|nr:glucose 1-dehydrogenase [Streptosporangium brasiliense]MDP9864062.1 NAD(P)-dependent dehydrogenase (short-subunit alcohol dehydrogenase family) [Streptosporangium brasiliense]